MNNSKQTKMIECLLYYVIEMANKSFSTITYWIFMEYILSVLIEFSIQFDFVFILYRESERSSISIKFWIKDFAYRFIHLTHFNSIKRCIHSIKVLDGVYGWVQVGVPQRNFNDSH